jgi:hypothetical protein
MTENGFIEQGFGEVVIQKFIKNATWKILREKK